MGLLALVHSSFALQPYSPAVDDPLLKPAQWQKLPELEANKPQCMVEANDGAMWFGINKGVLRYDGLSWTTYAEDHGLVAPVTALFCSRAGSIYAGSTKGLAVFDGNQWTFVITAPADESLRVDAIIETSDGSIWVATDKCFLRYRPNDLIVLAESSNAKPAGAAFPGAKVVTFPEGLTPDEHGKSYYNRRAIIETKDHQLWMALDNGGVIRCDLSKSLTDENAWHIVSAAEGFHRGERATFCETSDGILWVGNDQHDIGINQYDPATQKWSYFRFSDILGTDEVVWSITQTRDGTVWVGGFSQLFRYQNGKWRVYRSPEAPVSSSRTVLMESRSGSLWALGLNDNVQKVDYRSERWTEYDGLNFQCTTPDGNQWFIAKDDGVVRFDGKTWMRYGTEDGLISAPMSLICTRQGQLWAAGSDHGQAATACFDGSRWQLKLCADVVPAFGISLDHRAVFEAADGSLWFACYVDAGVSGLLRYVPSLGPPQSNDAWKHYEQRTLLRTSYGLGQLADGRLFSGSPWGLMEFDGENWKRSDLVGEIQVDAVTNSPGGHFLWIGTRGRGLYRYDGKDLVRFETKDGLLANAVTALLCDQKQGLWVGTSNGVSHFDGIEWSPRIFSEEKIAMGNEGGGFRQSADGALWINRMSRDWVRRVFTNVPISDTVGKNYRTSRYRPVQVVPRTEITLGLTRVAQPGNTVISWRGIVPWWETKESDITYSYRLDEGPWSRFAHETNHVFLRIPTGNHMFEVRAKDRDLNVETKPAKLTFEVLPPVWQETWFLLLMITLLGVIVGQTVRVIRRGHGLRISNTQLEHKSQQLEVQKTQLEGEIVQRKHMEREMEKTHAQLILASRQAGMAEVATDVLHNVGNVLNSVNVSGTITMDRLRSSRIHNLGKIADLLSAHAHEPAFLIENAKGKQIPPYLKELTTHLSSENEAMVTELSGLLSNIDHIKGIVQMQQTHSQMAGMSETVKISELIEDAIRMNIAALDRHGVQLERDYQADLTVHLEKHKVLQILVNLIRNAKEACDLTDANRRKLTIRVRELAPDRVQIQVIDTGGGISTESLPRIFTQGFTTRKGGHGYGLHNSANTAKELGGTLTAQSEGTGRGATFTLEIPRGKVT